MFFDFGLEINVPNKFHLAQYYHFVSLVEFRSHVIDTPSMVVLARFRK